MHIKKASAKNSIPPLYYDFSNLKLELDLKQTLPKQKSEKIIEFLETSEKTQEYYLQERFRNNKLE